MPSRKISILAPFKTWGGIESKIVTLAQEFLNKGLDVEILLAREGKVPYPERLPKQTKIVDLASKGKLNTAMKLVHRLRHHPPDALLTAKDHAAKAAILARSWSRVKVPIYIKITNTQSEVLRRPGKKMLAKLIYPYADGAITISEGVRKDFLNQFRMPSKRVTTIYNPTITPDFPARASKTINHPWLREDGPPVIIGMGRLTSQKDFSTLIRAFAKLRDQQPARLMILGEGPLREELENLVHRLNLGADVDLHGFVPDPLPWLARARLFVLSSRYEGLGNVLIEALAAGIPAVATDCPSGPREILEDGRLGELVTVGDPNSLAKAMQRTLNNPPSAKEGLKSLERFKSEIVARQYLDFMGLDPDK